MELSDSQSDLGLLKKDGIVAVYTYYKELGSPMHENRG
jgi:hypothetical protein